MGEVLQGKLFMYAALYEPDANNDWHVTYWTGCSNDTDPDANVYGGDSMFPKRGREAVPGSLVDFAIRGMKSHLTQHITLLEDTYEDGLVAIARPLIISGIPTKVAMVVLLEQNRDLLLPQIKRSKPVVVERFHRHL